MLYILEATSPDQLDDDRAVLHRELGHPRKVVLIVRGDEPGLATFVQDAGQAADRPWRVVVWVKNPAVFEDEDELFASRDEDAVLLDFRDEPAAYLSRGMMMIEIDDAFRQAELGQG